MLNKVVHPKAPILRYTMSREVTRTMKTELQIGLRVTSQFKERLASQAEKDHRSLSNLIIKVMSDYLDAIEKQESLENSTGNNPGFHR